MATVVPAPFWVPRPSDDFAWIQQPRAAAPIRMLTVGKFYSGNGQVVTRNYNSLYTQDSGESFWLGKPLPGYWPYAAINFKELRTPGQVNQYNWSAIATYQDDAPQWVGAPTKSNILYNDPYLNLLAQGSLHAQGVQDESGWHPGPRRALLTQVLTNQTMYGVAGQVPASRYLASTAVDDPPTWWPSSQTLGSFAIPFLTKSKFYGQGGQVVQFHANVTYSDDSYWVGMPAAPACFATYYPPPVQQASKTVRPAFYSPLPGQDGKEYSPQPTASLLLSMLTAQIMYGAAGQVPTPRQTFVYADDAFWQGQPIGIRPTQGTVPHNLYMEYLNLWQDDAIWVAAPLLSGTVFQLRTGVVKPYIAPTGSDDYAFWLGIPQGAGTVRSTSQTKYYTTNGQVVPFVPRWYLDDSAAWSPVAVNNVTAFFQLSVNPMFMPPQILYGEDDLTDGLWSWSSDVQTNNNTIQLKPIPDLIKRAGGIARGQWLRDDAAEFVGKPIPNTALFKLLSPTIYGGPGQAYPFRPRWDYDDFAVWQGRSTANPLNEFYVQITYPPGTTTALTTLRSRWSPLNYDTAETFFSIPSTTAIPSQNFLKGFPPLPVFQYWQWQSAYDDASRWYAQPIASYQTLHNSFQPSYATVYVPTGGDSAAAFWVGSPTAKNLNVVPPLTQGPKPLDLYPWLHTEEPAGWNWRPNTPVLQSALFVVKPTATAPAPTFGIDLNPPTWWPTTLRNATLAFVQVVPASILWAPDDVDENAAFVGGGIGGNPNLRPPSQVPGRSIIWVPSGDANSVWSGGGIQSNQQLLGLPPHPPGQPAGQYPRGIWRHDDPSTWEAKPLTNAALFKLTNQTLFGAAGQVLPFRPNLTLDDPAYWLGAPQPSAIVIGVTQFYGQKGQVLPFRPNFTLDDPQQWQGSPSAAWPLSLLGQPKLFGQGGQVLPFRPNWTLDDPATWNPLQYPPLILQQTKIVYPPGTTTAGLFTLRWPTAAFNYDQDAVQWVGKPFSPDYMLNAPTAPPPTKKFDWIDFFRRGRRRQ